MFLKKNKKEAATNAVKLNFDELFYWTIYCLKLTGSHPDIPRNLAWGVRFVILHGIFTATAGLIFYSAIFHDLKRDVALACSNVSFDVVYMYNTLSYFVLLRHQNIFKSLFKTVRKDYEIAKTLPAKEREMVELYGDKGSFVSKSWMFIIFCFFNVFITKPLMMMLYFTVTSEFKYVQALDLTYPARIEENKDSITVFSVVFLMLTYSDIYSSFMYAGLVPVGPICMLHACGQLELLKMRMMQLFPQDGTYIDPEERRKKLNDIAKHLQEIYDFVDDVKTSFKIMFEFTLKGTALILPIVAYQIVDAYRKGQTDLEFTFGLMCGGIALSGYPCFYGDFLIEKSESFRESVYMSNWETHWEKPIRSTLLMIMTRTERTVAIRSMFRVICLDALADVYHQAYALFSVLNAAWG